MNKKFYDLQGKIKIDKESFSIDLFRSTIAKFDRKTKYQESENHLTFSSDITEALSLIPIPRYTPPLKPSFFYATSYVTIKYLNKNGSDEIEYILSLKRLFLIGISVTIASFIPYLVFDRVLLLVAVPLIMTYFWVFIYPLCYVGMHDELENFIKVISKPDNPYKNITMPFSGNSR